MGPIWSRTLHASHQASMRARVAASSGYSEHLVEETRKRAIALDSKMHVPSGVSSTGTLPKGFFAKNSGVLLSTPIVNGAISSGTPAQPAAALTRSERPVLPYSFMLCGPIEGVRKRRRRRGGRDPRGARAREEKARRASGGTGEPREEATRARDAQKTRTRSHAFLDACLSRARGGTPGASRRGTDASGGGGCAPWSRAGTGGRETLLSRAGACGRSRGARRSGAEARERRPQSLSRRFARYPFSLGFPRLKTHSCSNTGEISEGVDFA